MAWNGLTPNSFWYDQHRLLFNKDCRSMIDLPDEYVQMCVTSPPYWGLRKYAGLPDLIWGGEKDCQHDWGNEIETGDNRFRGVNANVGTQGNPEVYITGKALSSFCSFCGAWKGQLGLEPTPELYIEHLVEIFREVRRVLRSDGCVFLNIGDSYAGSNSGKGDYREKKGLQKDIYDYDHPQANAGKWDKWRRGVGGEEHGTSLSGIPKPLNLKPKDLCLIPFRMAIALQEDGWWVRSVIIWSKLNPMPESVQDRPTESHEYILMLTKSARYYYDQEAVREEYTEPLDRWGGDNMRKSSHKYIDTFDETGDNGGIGKLGATSMFREGRPVRPNGSGRNRRSVWTFPTQSFSGAHFAVYPEKLVEICVKAASPEVGCCSKCGKAWVRLIRENKNYQAKDVGGKSQLGDLETGKRFKDRYNVNNQTLGWKAQCSCNADKVPSIVLDCFGGAGTTALVATKLGRRSITYELSKQYCNLVVDRNKQGAMV